MERNTSLDNQNINDYQVVEYIESTGTQYIDTGFIPNQDTSIELSLYTSQLGAQDFLVQVVQVMDMFMDYMMVLMQYGIIIIMI